MSIFYTLTVAGTDDHRSIAERAFPGTVLSPSGTTLFGDFSSAAAFTVNVAPAVPSYVSGHDGEQEREWEWERAVWINVDVDSDRMALAANSALHVVARVLASGPEDAALVQYGDWLLLTRSGGRLRKFHRDTWWKAYDGLNDTIPDE